ncbi:MAG: Cell division protein FtsW [Acidimicrobiia bacterium]|nr:Cell division protein FtsW [Acidimicrobiia bacterium]
MIGALRRNTELGLIVLAVAVTAGAYTLGALGTTATLPANIGPFLGAVLGLLIVAHLACRRYAKGADGVLLPLAAVLNGLGYVFIARLNTKVAGLQATWTFIGVAAFVATLVLVRRVRDLSRWKWTFALVGLLILLLPLVPGLGYGADARLWVRVGGITFQPGEIAKLMLAIFLAAYLMESRELLAVGRKFGPFQIPEGRDLFPLLLAWGASLVIMIGQKDLGSSLLFFTLFLVMVWVATERASYLAIGLILFVAGAFGAYHEFQHVRTRVTIWLDPWNDDKGYQLVQSSFAMAWGGLTGTGIGRGHPGLVPAVKTDFILSAIGEELGLVGTTAIVISYVLMVGAGLRIALKTEDTFSKLLATGLTTILGIQAFIIIGGVTRLVPLTGVTLPFVSYGGSSLIANYVLIALLLRISHETAAKAGEVER